MDNGASVPSDVSKSSGEGAAGSRTRTREKPPRKEKFKVTVRRWIAQECCVYVDAVDIESAEQEALNTAEEVADLVWDSSNAEPRSYEVDNVQLAKELSRK